MLITLISHVNRMLHPYAEKIADLFALIEELERRLDNQIKPARVIKIHEDGQLIQCSFDNNKTPFIKWFAGAAGEVSEYRCPSIGEQCALINYGGGEDSAQVWALCGIPSDQYPLPGNTPGIQVIKHADDLHIVINSAAKTIATKAEGSVSFDTPDVNGSGNISDSRRSMEADRGIYDGHAHTGDSGGNTSATDSKQGS